MITKKEIYAKYGIEYDTKTQKILSPVGYVKPLLINGNAKIGKGVYHFSTLPTNQIFDVVINGRSYAIKGTCVCSCVGCYATKANYRYQSTKNALGMRTLMIREYLDFAERAIRAQIEADNIKIVRIHAAGDFDSLPYLTMWMSIVKDFPCVLFWTYTKVKYAENAFDNLVNANIVKSVIRGHGFNFGHADYVLDTYKALKEAGKSVHVCRCGTENGKADAQHCTNCKGCATHEYVLFLEHSTDYKAKDDPNFSDVKALAEKLASNT